MINRSPAAECNTFDDMKYMCISGVSGRSGMRGHLEELGKAVETIELIRKAGSRVLSHCFYRKTCRWVWCYSVFLHLDIFVKLNLMELREIFLMFVSYL